jgi:predicted phage gp36 major capsid-like protein
MPAFLIAALKHWKLVGLGLLCLALAVQTVRLGHAENKADNLRFRLKEVVAERDSLVAAAKEAERLNAAQVRRIEADQEKVNDEIERDLTARLERLRSELRSKAAGSNPAGPKAGSDGEAPADPVGEAGLCLTSDQLLRAAESEERHDQLISWVEKQLQVER